MVENKAENMRKALRLIKRRVTFTLQHNAGSEEVLLEVLKGVHATAELAIKGIEVS